MGHTRGLETARDYQVTDDNLGYGIMTAPLYSFIVEIKRVYFYTFITM